MPAFLIGSARRRAGTVATAFAAVALTAVALVGSGPAWADDDEETFEQGIIRSLLGGGSKPPIEYRERSPLVIPPNGDNLPAPSGAAVSGNPAWPQDPDKRKPGSNKVRRAMGADESEREGSRNLRPEEMRRGAVASARSSGPAPTQSENDQGRPLRPTELGGPSLFSIFGREKTADAEAFKGEPTRSRMTEPPSGYRTPTASQPYQEPRDAPGSWFRAINPFDRGTN